MSDLDLARSYYYEFLAYPLFFDENGAKFENFQAQREYLEKAPITDENLGDFDNIKSFDFAKFKIEQNDVLFDFSYANVPLSASFFDEGRDDGFKRLKVIEILKKSNHRKNEAKFKNSEDFIGFIFLLMVVLIKENEELAKELFSQIINNFADEFCKMLAEHKRSNFFKSYANLLENFISIERAFYGLTAPIFERSLAKESMEREPYHTRMATPKSKIHWEEFGNI